MNSQAGTSDAEGTWTMAYAKIKSTSWLERLGFSFGEITGLVVILADSAAVREHP
ncbi:MAG: hypothetical protein GX055_03220 [Desulfovibrionales bacterium]|nr:hypothetical protein [Desulfovibrionales bacterium]